ncbi:MAG: NADH-quinone oxidoreductase subunit M [Bacteroidota bacterium]|nr:NADH-quinone oxidoreductase subunit M [Bacteroidota bacterium]
MNNILSILIFLPLILSFPIFFFKKEKETLIKSYAFVISLIPLAIATYLFFAFDPANSDYQFVEKTKWISMTNTYYFLGIDGISMLLIVMSAFMFPLSILASWTSIKENLKQFYFLLLLLDVSLIGVFASLDLILFYIFWEFILIPMYFIIGVWGAEDRIYATVKFFLYTMFGSLLMLIGIIWLSFLCVPLIGEFTTDLTKLTTIAFSLPPDKQVYLFILFTLSFLIKVPLFPFHTWLPDAHVQAPTAGSVILAAVLLKMGTYGLIRFSLPLFPAAFIKLTPYIATLAVIGIVYGALLSIVQKDIKKLVAYSSVSHLGFIVLGTFALTDVALQGSIIQMINHGLSTGALFMIVGVLYERRHTKKIADFGGIMKVMPVFSVIFMIVVFSSIGLPGLNGFVGEFLILLGSFYSTNLGTNAYSIISTSAVILAAIYLLWMFQRVMLGPIDNEKNKELQDLTKREVLSFIPIIIFIVWIGVHPNTFLSKTESSVKRIINNFQVSKNKLGLNNDIEIEIENKLAESDKK